jgi:DNA replication protein DnaC
MLAVSENRFVNSKDLYCPECKKTQTHRNIFNGTFYCMGCVERSSREHEEKQKREAEEQKKSAYFKLKKKLLSSTGIEEAHLGLVNRQNNVLNEQLNRYYGNLEQNINDGKGLFLYGKVGTGKTTAAVKIALKAVKLGLSVEYIKAYEDLRESNLKHCDLLIIDELHLAVRMFGDKSCDEDKRTLYMLVETRRNRRKSTIFLSNYTEVAHIDRLGPELYDRIADKARTISLEFTGLSFRS